MGKLSSLLKLKPFFKKYRLFFWFAIIETVLCSIVATPVPYIIGYIMDKILVKSKNYNQLYYCTIIMAVLYLLRFLMSISSKYMYAKINNLIVNELRYLVIDKVMTLPMSYLSNTEKGYIQSRISECNSVGSIFSSTMVSILVNIFDALSAMVTMFLINYKLAIVVAILAPIFFFLSKVSGSGFTSNTRNMLEANAVLNGECFEIINGMEDIKILNGKAKNLANFKNKLDKFVKVSLKQSKAMLLFTEIITVANNFGTLIILLFSGILIIQGRFTIGLYTSFSLYIGKVFNCTQILAMVGTTLKQSCLSIERLYELLDMKDENYGKDAYLDTKLESLKLENVTFKYNNNTKNVLNSLSFEINSGEKVLIKGENGSGKSTIIKLLLGLYEPIEGKILYNNLDSAIINNNSLRGRIGIVSQSIFLFKGTVLDNILYGQYEKKREDVEKLISELKLEYYINRLPKGLDSEIIQNTAGISGGQTQVIAFIRAMLSNKDVLILDEPISNVDIETRNIILNILKKNRFEGILIIVSHLVEGIDFISKTIEIDKQNKIIC